MKLPYTVTELEVLLVEAQYVQSNTRMVGEVMQKEEEVRPLSAILKLPYTVTDLEVLLGEAQYVQSNTKGVGKVT